MIKPWRIVSSKPLTALMLAGSLWCAQAQTVMPVVTVHSPDPHATWSGDTGTFTFFRDGPTNDTLNVFFVIGGTATNGVDYTTIANTITIPAGVRTNSALVSPINNGQTDTRTVEVRLTPPPFVPPVNYVIGNPSNAVVYITGPNTNIPPFVAITQPPPGAMFPANANIPICAQAYDVDGFVSTVEFFAGTNSLGVRTNNPMSTGPMNPFCLIWSNVPPGTYELHALATDNGGATTLSHGVVLFVGNLPPPPTNLPPFVHITSPANGSVFPAPATIPLYAYARDLDDGVASVEFFDGTNSLGFGSNVCDVVTPPPTVCPTNVYLLIWSNAPVGTHILRAVATDTRGASSTSDRVLVTVFTPPPPPTNRPPVITIFASDPIAIEGTNCYPWRGLTNSMPTWGSWGDGTNLFHWFTNCGPKNATFVVRRYGATNDDVTVNYLIGGTATNGVDYLPLSGSVTIPAGERRALITVVPIDDGPPDMSSTVVLRLQPSASAPADYVLGFPRAAAALILDGAWPRPGTGLLGDHSFHLNASGPDGAWFRVDYSTDMVNWQPILDSQVVNGSIDFIDPDGTSAGSRFYRAVPELTQPQL